MKDERIERLKRIQKEINGLTIVSGAERPKEKRKK
jgi:hypothetical protein